MQKWKNKLVSHAMQLDDEAAGKCFACPKGLASWILCR